MMVLLPPALPPGKTSSANGPGPSQPGRLLTLDDRLQTTIPDFDASGRPMVVLLLRLAYKYELPMAIEYAARETVRRPLDLRLRGCSLRDVIASVVEAAPGYRVDFAGGLVDVYSPDARLDPSNPCNTLVNDFDVTDTDTHFADTELLCALSRQVNPLTACGGSVVGGQWGDLKITLHMRNKKVYEILNAIVAQNGRAVWAPIAPLNKPAELGPNARTNFWYIYPLDPPFEAVAVQRLESLFPPSGTTGTH